MVLVKKSKIFWNLFFSKIGLQIVLSYGLKRKKPFLTIEVKINESPKNGYFPKRLTHAFGPRMAIFPTFFFRQYRPGKCVLRYFKTKKRLSRLQRRRVQKVEKLRFFQRGYPMLLVQKWPYFQLFFLGNIGQKNVFYDILEPKNACRGYKNNKSQKVKN